MDVVIEVVAAEGSSLMDCPKVRTIKSFIPKVVGLVSQTATSILRPLFQGSTSMNAVSPDNNFAEGGLAVA
jgi:hypothetical protein